MRWPFGKRLRERVATLEDHRDAVLVRIDGIQAHHYQNLADLCCLYSRIQERVDAVNETLERITASLAPKSTPSVKRKISPSKRKRAK